MSAISCGQVCDIPHHMFVTERPEKARPSVYIRASGCCLQGGSTPFFPKTSRSEGQADTYPTSGTVAIDQRYANATAEPQADVIEASDLSGQLGSD